MPDKIIVVGAGRQGRNVAEIFAGDQGVTPMAGFLDDTKVIGDIVDEAPVLGNIAKIDDAAFVATHRWHVAIGDCQARFDIAARLDAQGARFVSAFHSASVISGTAQIGRGLYVAAFARIMTGSMVGDWCLIESGTLLGTDTRSGAACLLGPGCRMLGGASLGNRTLAGAGAVILNDVGVGSDCLIGANAVVRHDVPDSSKVFGIPATAAAHRL